jgi:hypothetical protein
MADDWAVREMAGVELKDGRRVKSVIRICTALGEQPQQSLSASLGPGLRQAGHRIFEHPDTTVDRLLAGHIAATSERCREHPFVLIAQDTTVFVYHQEHIVGLAPVNGSERSRGLLSHGALALTPDGTPLGVIHLDLWGADAAAPAPPLGPPRNFEDRESYKWTVALQSVSQRIPDETRALLIQDREGDLFQFLSEPRPPHIDLLVRAAQDRVVEYEVLTSTSAAPECANERGRLFGVAAAAPGFGCCEVLLPPRSAQKGRPARRARLARLELRVTEVRIQPPGSGPLRQRDEVRLWLVQAHELEPPPNEEPIHWVLLTTQPVDDAAAATRTVGYYARRWTIERLHYTLKSGLKAERLQIDDAESLKHCLALYYVVAWRIMYLTHLARECPQQPADRVLEAGELEVLEAVTKRVVATIAQAVSAIAVLGGHEPYRNGPPPGVKSLWNGLQRLAAMVIGWDAARAGVDLNQLMNQA